jgi:hypothetical protein
MKRNSRVFKQEQDQHGSKALLDGAWERYQSKALFMNSTE